jgi:hypothetical protein
MALSHCRSGGIPTRSPRKKNGSQRSRFFIAKRLIYHLVRRLLRRVRPQRTGFCVRLILRDGIRL